MRDGSREHSGQATTTVFTGGAGAMKFEILGGLNVTRADEQVPLVASSSVVC